MKIEVDTVKGFQDFLPFESLKRRAVKKIIEKNFQLYGFLPVETPIIEFDEIMREDNLEENDQAISDRFRLKDRAGRNLGLRYEFTFQLARIFKLNPTIKIPFRRYQIGEVFRDEPTGTGRFRQFTQCDIDIVGDESVEAELDCLLSVNSILKELGIKAQIEINNRKLLSSIIESVEIKSSQFVMRELDKILKIGEDDVKLNLRKYAETNQIITLFKLLEKDVQFFKENKFDGAEELDSLIKLCKQQGIKVSFNPFMTRGLTYYTGNIFEVMQEGSKISIAGGGRYDKTIGKFLEKEIPAVGISFGLERVAEIASVEIKNKQVVIISLSKESIARSFAKSLRESNVPCTISFGKPGKALDYANSYKIPYAVFIGDDEIKKKKFKLKDMNSGEEKLLSEERIIQFLSKNLYAEKE